tara:strand:- start:1932 stop:5030 length:3099 start_codon:yes stop_codon:yes gene_type:complete
MTIKANPIVANEYKDVISTIQSYTGCKDVFAALAQEPVQNAKDNGMPNSDKPPTITYKLEENNGDVRLIITDEFTTGLDGPVQTPEEIEELMSKGNIEQISNHSAFFADNVTTKENRDSSGSRGQGKKAALFHGRFFTDNEEKNGRILMVIDTYTRDENNKNTYRTSYMYFTPRKNHIGPVENKSGRSLLEEIDFTEVKTLTGANLVDAGLKEDKLKLDLKPLTKHGTRLIIPYLHPETVEKFKDGTMVKWLERIWWNAILEGKVKIILEMDGNKNQIKCLEYWKEKPWNAKNLTSKNSKEKGTFYKENIKINGTSKPAKRILGKNPKLKIKRIVFDWDINRPKNEINDGRGQTELSGVQWIRNHQWITTKPILSLSQSLIPNIEEKEKFYDGFRGFVEFDDDTCRVLKDDSIESPQHHEVEDNADTNKIWEQILIAFQECAEENGWMSPEEGTAALDKDFFNDILDLGAWGQAGIEKPQSQLNATINFLTESKTNLVKWNETIKDIEVTLGSKNEKSLKEIVFGADRPKPLRPPGTTKQTLWEDVELRLAMIIYKVRGHLVKKSDPLFNKFIQFTGRSPDSLTLRLANYDAVHRDNEPGTMDHYREDLVPVYEEYIEKDDAELLSLFTKLIEKAQKDIETAEELSCKLQINKPNNEKIELGVSKSPFDLNEKFIMEDSFDDLKIDKKTIFDLKKKYELIATWIDGYGVEVASARRVFYVQERPEEPTPSPYNLIVSFKNLTTDEETDSFSYKDKIRISMSIRNRTEEEITFHGSASLGNHQLLEKDFKVNVPGKEEGAEYIDYPIYEIEKEIRQEVSDKQKEKGLIDLPKGRVEFRMDIYDLKHTDGEIPKLDKLVDEFEININQRYVRKNLFIEQEGEGNKYFNQVVVERKTGDGKHFWHLGIGYLQDPLPDVNIYELHPIRVFANKNSENKKIAKFDNRDFGNLVIAEATIEILVGRHLNGGDSTDEVDMFISNGESMNTEHFQAHELYMDSLRLLKNIDNQKNDYFQLEKVKTDLISSLLAMLLAKGS